ncbi:MAG: hypothetical protein K2J80_04980 [Oscillospiraceae bacterium]|nr:hypothetical protein [Oscillospiraceae bacterium]
MIKSYKIFAVKSQLRQLATFELAVTGIMAAAGVVKKIVTVTWLITVLDGAAALLAAAMFPVAAMVMLMGLYNANAPEQPSGYKYFHSLKNSADCFRDALIFANIFSLISILIFFAVMWFFFDSRTVLYLMCFVFTAIGATNFFGHSRSIYPKIIPYTIMGFSIGIYGAMFGEENDPTKSDMFLTVFGVAAAAVYIGGLIWTIARARSAWERGNDK